MIEALKSDEIVRKVGGRFKLTALIQKRMMELMEGARPLVERHDGKGDGELGEGTHRSVGVGLADDEGLAERVEFEH